MAISCKENMWGSWSCSPCGKYGGTQINTDANMTLEAAELRCNKAARLAQPNTPIQSKENYNKMARQKKLREFGSSSRTEFNNVHFGGSNDIRSGRNEFGNVHFGGSNEIQSGRNEFNNVFFRGDREVDHNKTQFNRSGAFDDGASYFRGGSPDTFEHSHDRNIVYNASGCGQMNARGKKRPPINPFTPTTGGYDPYGAKQTGGACPPDTYPCATGCCSALYPEEGRQIGEPEECVGGCSPALGVGCPKGCECWKKRCVPNGYARKKKLYSTQADDPANRKLNAKGRAAGLPKPKRNEKVKDYANRIGYKLIDPDGIITEREDGCRCTCMGSLTGDANPSGMYADFPSGFFVRCCGGRACAHVGAFREGELIVQPLNKRTKPSKGKRPAAKGKVIARGSGYKRTKDGIVLLNDIGENINVGKTSHPCCNGGNLCNSTMHCFDSDQTYAVTGCCDSVSPCSFEGFCGGAYVIYQDPQPEANTQGSTNFRGRDLSNGGFRLR